MSSFCSLRGIVAGAVLLASASAAVAQEWPGSRAVQVISMFAAGNANDIVARIVLDQAFRQMNASYVI